MAMSVRPTHDSFAAGARKHATATAATRKSILWVGSGGNRAKAEIAITAAHQTMTLTPKVVRTAEMKPPSWIAVMACPVRPLRMPSATRPVNNSHLGTARQYPRDTTGLEVAGPCAMGQSLR